MNADFKDLLVEAGRPQDKMDIKSLMLKRSR